MSSRLVALGLLFLGGCGAEISDTHESIDTDVAEPNNTRALAYGVLPPARIEASLDSRLDSDWYMFEASQTSKLRLVSVDPSLELYLELEDTQGRSLASWDTGGRGASLTATLPPRSEGTLYLKVYSAYVDETGRYTLSVQ